MRITLLARDTCMKTIRFTTEDPYVLDAQGDPDCRKTCLELKENRKQSTTTVFQMLCKLLKIHECHDVQKMVIILPCNSHNIFLELLSYIRRRFTLFLNDENSHSLAMAFAKMMRGSSDKLEKIEPIRKSLVDANYIAERLGFQSSDSAVIVQLYNKQYGMEYSSSELRTIIDMIEEKGPFVILDAKYSPLYYANVLKQFIEAGNHKKQIMVVGQTNTSIAASQGMIVFSPDTGILKKLYAISRRFEECTYNEKPDYLWKLCYRLCIISKTGLEKWLANHKEKAELAYNRLVRYGFATLYDVEAHKSMFFPAFKPPADIEPFSIFQYLLEKGFLIDKPSTRESIVLSTMGDTTLSEFNTLLETIIFYTL